MCVSTKQDCKTGNCKTDCKSTKRKTKKVPIDEAINTIGRVLVDTVEKVDYTGITLVALIQMMIDDGTIDEDKLNAFIKNNLEESKKSR